MSFICMVGGLSLGDRVEFGHPGETRSTAAAPSGREGSIDMAKASAQDAP